MKGLALRSAVQLAISERFTDVGALFLCACFHNSYCLHEKDAYRSKWQPPRQKDSFLSFR